MKTKNIFWLMLGVAMGVFVTFVWGISHVNASVSPMGNEFIKHNRTPRGKSMKTMTPIDGMDTAYFTDTYISADYMCYPPFHEGDTWEGCIDKDNYYGACDYYTRYLKGNQLCWNNCGADPVISG